MIYVLYATKVNIGGWATFTRHLVDSLRAEGQAVALVKLGNRDEAFVRPFGPAHFYRNITLDALVADIANNPSNHCIIAALGKHYIAEAQELMSVGAKMVIHDTAESSVRMDLGHKPWAIRKTLAKQFDGIFIRHPYVKVGGVIPARRNKNIYATSRVDFDKNTTMILDANRLGAKIDIVGFENRLYTKFKVMPLYPEWKQSADREHPYPKTGAGSFELLRNALAMVDLTDIKGDGGGTQYTFLEAWDAGAVPIIGEWWLKKNDDMLDDKNCYAIGDAKELASLAKECRRYGIPPGITEAGYKALKRHAPKVIVPQVLEWLNA